MCLNQRVLCPVLSERENTSTGEKKVTISLNGTSQASSNPAHPVCYLSTPVLLKIYSDLFSVSVTASSLLRDPTVPNVTLINHQP